MKSYFTVFLFFISGFVFSQNQHALIVYLSDAETGKNVKNAKVTLEGFEIPTIRGKYDKKKKFYYFDEIPKGYNTVMAYHKKYNEKGFQDVNGLPKELRFKLDNPLNVTYRFIKDNYVFVEDQFKIAIASKDYGNYDDFRKLLMQKVEDLGLAIELVNPYWEKDQLVRNPYHNTQKEAYPSLRSEGNLNMEYVFPLLSGISNVDNSLSERGYSMKPKDICFVFRKKDGSKFKRFNDPIISKLVTNKLIVSSILLNKRNRKKDYFSGTINYKIRDRLNSEFNQQHRVDSSEVFFYSNNFQNEKKPYQDFEMPNLALPEPSFILINEGSEEPINMPEIKEGLNRNFRYDSTGLGILDIYEYYFEMNLTGK